MAWTNPLNEKELFIRNEILNSTIAAAFRRANVYRKEHDKKKKVELEVRKEAFRRRIKKHLIKVGDDYSPLESPLHRIAALKKSIEEEAAGRDIFTNDQISFGVAQKLVNLYLKYLWCLGAIDEPKHCPIDRFVLNESKQTQFHPWTSMDREAYTKAVAVLERDALRKGISVAEWELSKFNEGNPSYTN